MTVLGTVLFGEPGRVAEDIALAASLGFGIVRLDIPWAAAQPKPDTVNGDVTEALLGLAELARQSGVQPWFRLLQPQVPRWFDNDGGFTDARNAGHWWPRWVETAADVFGGAAAGWVPFEAPFAMARRLIPDDPRTHGELIDTLVTAWRDAWRLLRGGPPVMTALDVAVVRPDDDSPPAIEAAARFDQLRWGVWLDGLRDGLVSIPGRADRHVADLDGACDIVGLAVRGDAETVLYRAAEQGPERPLALTFRPTGDNDAQRSAAVQTMWRGTRRAAAELALHSVTITPFADQLPGNDGIVTRDRELKDAGRSFLAR
ncbi:MAG: family 1 glycosylhydrolase [Ilumatobacteraceae bacterium]